MQDNVFIEKTIRRAMYAVLVIGVITLPTLNYLVRHESKPDAPQELGGKTVTIEDVEDTLLAKYGDYVQVTDDGTLYVKGHVVTETTLSNILPPGVTIDVYHGPTGNGFIIVTDSATSTYYKAYGPAASDFTELRVKPDKTATTSP